MNQELLTNLSPYLLLSPYPLVSDFLPCAFAFFLVSVPVRLDGKKEALPASLDEEHDFLRLSLTDALHQIAERREVGDELVSHSNQKIAGGNAVLVAAHTHRRLDHDHALLIGLEEPGGDVVVGDLAHGEIELVHLERMSFPHRSRRPRESDLRLLPSFASQVLERELPVRARSQDPLGERADFLVPLHFDRLTVESDQHVADFEAGFLRGRF